jgi:DNA invertase Pin-like site-specific DNA recombinase
MPLAYSYLRFSSPQQATGDSIRRQTQSREAWLSTHPKVQLDRSLSMTDAGKSAFNRKNRDTYALTRFVDYIKAGRVEPGSYLLVENLDRLSREDAGEATELFLSIVNKGVIIVQLSPAVMEFKRPVDIQGLMFAIVELSRGHSESAIKSERGRAFWARKQREAGKRIVTRKLPGWVRADGDKLVLIPEHAATVRRIYALARDGHGVQSISQRLNIDGVPVMGRTTMKGKPVTWSATNIYYILRSQATIGVYVPYRRRGEGSLSPIPDYFPPVVSPDTYHAVQNAIALRTRGGRRGNHVNLFSGLLTDARDGGTLTYWHTGGRSVPVIISVNAKEGRKVKWVSFPAAAFETAILSKLAEVKAKDIQGGDDAGKKVEALAGQVAELDNLIGRWTGKMDNPSIVDTVAAKLADLSDQRKAVAESLSQARGEAASPIPEVWGEFKTLADLLSEDDSDDLRLKVRAALRRAIERVYVLIVPQSKVRLAAVRVQFAGSKAHRDYWIVHRKAIGGAVGRRDAETEVWTWKDVGAGPIDLSSQKDVAKLVRELERTSGASHAR